MLGLKCIYYLVCNVLWILSYFLLVWHSLSGSAGCTWKRSLILDIYWWCLLIFEFSTLKRSLKCQLGHKQTMSQIKLTHASHKIINSLKSWFSGHSRGRPTLEMEPSPKLLGYRMVVPLLFYVVNSTVQYMYNIQYLILIHY